MQTEIVSATNALEGFATEISTTWTDQPWQNAVGAWNTPPLSREDLASRARRLAERLKVLNEDQVDGALFQKINNLPVQISWFQSSTLPQLSNGNNLPQVVFCFDMIMSNVEQELPREALPDWEEVANSNLIPNELAKRIRSLDAALKRLAPKEGELEEKIKRIKEANAAAIDLPTDMQALKEARDEVARHVDTARKAAEQAVAHEAAGTKSLGDVMGEAEAAKKLVQNIESAYSAATTAGLAAAFTERAKTLNNSTWLWVFFLVVALVAGGVVGAHRLSELEALAGNPKANPQWLWLNAGMSMLAIAAPVWFAWLATRQISQRFRLSEDYAFKASVARAYEGYRREAARLDPELEARLFASALDRLEEAPLRFLAVEEHGSPYEALLASTGFQKALEKVPNLREMAADVVERATASAKAVAETGGKA